METYKLTVEEPIIACRRTNYEIKANSLNQAFNRMLHYIGISNIVDDNPAYITYVSSDVLEDTVERTEGDINIYDDKDNLIYELNQTNEDF